MKVLGGSATWLILLALTQGAGFAQLSSSWTALNRAGDYSNGEEQCYTPANVQVTGGNLIETFQSQSLKCGDATHSPSNFSYTSGMVQWTNFNFLHGTLEVRAKVANTSLWPAIWLLGADCQASNIQSADNIGTCNWPQSGSDEVDIAEFAPNDPSSRANVYSGGKSFPCGGKDIGDETQFHVFTFTWTASSLSWAVDGKTTCTESNLVPTRPMFLIINIAANNSARPSGLPQTNAVDYVKVTQNGVVTFFDDFTGGSGVTSSCDLNGDSTVDTQDVNLAINQAIGASSCGTADLDQNGTCDAVDVQRVINAALGQSCRTGP